MSLVLVTKASHVSTSDDIFHAKIHGKLADEKPLRVHLKRVTFVNGQWSSYSGNEFGERATHYQSVNT